MSNRMSNSVPIGPPEFAPRFKRITLDVKIPGAFIDYSHPSLDDPTKLEEHTKKTGQDSIDMNPNDQKISGSKNHPAGDFEKYYTPSTLDSRNRYRQHNRMQLSDATSLSVASTFFREAFKVGIVKPTKSEQQKRGKRGKIGHFRRLTVGDISPELGIIWDEEMGRRSNG